MKTMTLCTVAFLLLLAWLMALGAIVFWSTPIILGAAIIWALLMYVEPGKAEVDHGRYLQPHDEA